MIAPSDINIVLSQDIGFEDFTALHELLVSAFAYMDERIDPPSSLHRLNSETLRDKAESEYLALAFKDEELVGCLFACPRSAAWYVGKLAVRKDSRGLGIGVLLLETIQSVAVKCGCNALEVEVRVELVENHRFFEKCGFIKCGENAHTGYDSSTSFTFRKSVN